MSERAPLPVARPTPRGGPLFLGLDLGTSSVKALLVDSGGRVAGRGTAEYPIERPSPDRAEQDPAAWWAATVTAARAAIGAVAGGPGRVAGIGLSGQMHGAVLLDRRHRVLGRAIIWPDQRSAAQVTALRDDLGSGRIIEALGGPLATGFQAATLRWVREQEPDRWSRLALVLAPKDWLRLQLTGEVASEPSDGSGTGFLDARRRAWWPPMCEAVGLDPAALPPLRDGSAACGSLGTGAAVELGLLPGIPVATGGADTPCGLLGAGLVDASAMLLTLSTGGQLAVPSDEVVVDPGGRAHTFCGVLPPGSGAAPWYRMAAILSAGMALRWLRDDVLGLAGGDAYDRMVGWAADCPPGARGLVFLPYLVGERSPLMDPAARAVFLGLTARHGRAELVRAVLEGVTFACAEAAAVLEAAGGLPEGLVLAGGGARSAAWVGIVADVFGRPVRPLATQEQSALGACLLGGAVAGALDAMESARRWARTGPAVEPDGARHARYMELREIFRATYAVHADHFRRLRAIEDAASRPREEPSSPPSDRDPG